MGRPRCIIPIEKMQEAYENEGTTTRAAAKLGISRQTIEKYLRRAGIPMQPGRRKAVLTGTYAKWLERHEGDILPQGLRGLCELSGCTREAVKGYVYRRRAYLKKELARLPDLRRSLVLFTTTDGIRVPSKGFETYSYYIGQYTCALKIVAIMKPIGQRVTIEVTLDQLKEIADVVGEESN